MARASAGAANPYGRTGVRIVVAGDRGTGKSSLIVTAAAENFPANVPPVLPPTRLPEDFYPDRVPVTIIDTSSRCVCILFNYCSDFKLLCLVAEKSVGWEKKLVRWIGAVVWWFCCVVLCVKLERFSIFFGFWKSVFVHWESVGKKVRVWDYIGKNGVKCCVVSC